MNPNRVRKLVSLGFALAVFGGSLAFYIFSGPSDIAWLDGAYFQRQAVLCEIGDGPWDRPLYGILSQPFLLVPWEGLARRPSLASAVFAAGTCLFIYLLMKVFLQLVPQVIARRVGILAAVLLGVAHTFWLRAVTPGPEVLDALLLVAVLYFLVRFENEGRVGHLYAAMMGLGLSLANNLMMLFLLPVFAVYVRVVKPLRAIISEGPLSTEKLLRHRRPDRGGIGQGPRCWNHLSRHQTGESDGDGRWFRQDYGLWSGLASHLGVGD